MGKQNNYLGNHIEKLPNGISTLVDDEGYILVKDINNLTAVDANNPELINYQVSVGRAFTGAVEFFGGLPYMFIKAGELDPVEYNDILLDMELANMQGLWVSLTSPQSIFEYHPLVQAKQAELYFDGDIRMRQLELAGFDAKYLFKSQES